MKWQNIKTAPRDGTDILGWRKDAGVMLIRYTAPIDFLSEHEIEKLDLNEDTAETYDWFYADIHGGGRLEGDENPTHWMKIPEEPNC